jgi:hypothetical protein
VRRDAKRRKRQFAEIRTVFEGLAPYIRSTVNGVTTLKRKRLLQYQKQGLKATV